MDLCANCNKKLKIINFTCDCEKTFCMKCRFPETHNCDFDSNSINKEYLKSKLPKITSEKIIKI